MARMSVQMLESRPGFVGAVWDNKGEAARCGNTSRLLTRTFDRCERGLA